MEKVSRRQQGQIDFYYEHAQDIKKAKQVARDFILRLKNEKALIRWYDNPTEKALYDEKGFMVIYPVTFSELPRKIEIVFHIYFENLPSLKKDEVTSFYDGNVRVRTTVEMTLGKKHALAEMLEKEIGAYVRGIKNEIVFLKRFLIPLKRRFPKAIRYVHYAGEEKDFRKGVDFIVGAVPHGTNVFEVSFNLKSSSIFVGKHKKKYPNISTFVFQESYLQKYSELEQHFLAFLKKAITGPAHF